MRYGEELTRGVGVAAGGSRREEATRTRRRRSQPGYSAPWHSALVPVAARAAVPVEGGGAWPPSRRRGHMRWSWPRRRRAPVRRVGDDPEPWWLGLAGGARDGDA